MQKLGILFLFCGTDSLFNLNIAQELYLIKKLMQFIGENAVASIAFLICHKTEKDLKDLPSERQLKPEIVRE